MTEIRWTVNEIKRTMRAAGSHWFDPDTMRSFGTEILPEVYQGPGGVFFVTKDDQYRRELPKRYTVRQYTPDTNDIGTYGDLNAHKTAKEARKAAQRAAAGPGWPVPLVPEEMGGIPYAARIKTTAETYQPVTELEQFVNDLQKHATARPGVEVVTEARHLMRLARRHHRMMEQECNEGGLHDENGDPLPPLKNLRGHIRARARGLGCTSVIFSGDPRGCTVKLTFPDGFTDDFAKEGYCVPVEE